MKSPPIIMKYRNEIFYEIPLAMKSPTQCYEILPGINEIFHLITHPSYEMS